MTDFFYYYFFFWLRENHASSGMGSYKVYINQIQTNKKRTNAGTTYLNKPCTPNKVMTPNEIYGMTYGLELQMWGRIR